MGSGFVPERLPLQSRWPWLQNVDDVLGSGDEEEPGAQTPRSIATTNLGDVVAVPDAADYNSGDASASHKKFCLTDLSKKKHLARGRNGQLPQHTYVEEGQWQAAQE